MADSFFGFDTSLSNINDEDGGGGDGSEEEYDALNNETFGVDSDGFDWEVEHEQLAEQLESSRRGRHDDSVNSQLEASLSQLVLDDSDTPSKLNLTNVWQHELQPYSVAHKPLPQLKNVCTVEELERQLRQKQQTGINPTVNQNFFQPRFPVILQRPPNLQSSVQMPFAPQQPMGNLQQMNQPINKIHGQNNQLCQGNPLLPPGNQLGQNVNQFMQNSQMNQSGNQFIQNSNQMNQSGSQMIQNMPLGQSLNQHNQPNNQLMQNMNQLSQNINQMSQSNKMLQNQLGQSNNQLMQNQMGQPSNQMLQNMNQLGHSNNQLMQNMNQLGPPANQLMQNMNQLPQPNQLMQNQISQPSSTLMQNQMGQSGNNQLIQNMNQLGQTNNQLSQNNQMMPNGSQFGPNMANQMVPQHMMGQPRMMHPSGINVQRQNFNSNIGQYNTNFRGPAMPSKPIDQTMNQQNAIMNQQYQQQQIKNQSPQIVNQMLKQNQSPQNKPNAVQNMVQRTDQKNQAQKNSRSLVFNNSSQKGMTSQNLVQLIQNTHPMLQFNTGYHNASHHPMLNNRSNVFNNQMFNNQRINGAFNNNRHMMNGEEYNHGNGMPQSELDEYAGFMNQREKQWLLNIQMIQLNTGTPYIDDYYYTVFLERQSRKEKEGVKEAHKANQQNHPFYSGGVKQEQHTRERHNSGRHNSNSEDAPTPRTYVPAQFENSLGKLQCGSVTAPRKIIDVDVVQGETINCTSGRQSRAPSVASTNNPLESPQVRRTKQLLLDIEALYIILLRLEELNDPLAISNALILKERDDRQKQMELAQKDLQEKTEYEDSNIFLRNIESVQKKMKPELKETLDKRVPKSDPTEKRQVVNLTVSQNQTPVTKNLLDENKDELINKMFAGLLFEDRLQQFMMVRKGKALLVRFCGRVPAAHARLRTLWSRVLRALPSAARRDDGSITPLAIHFKRYIQNSSGWAAVLEACALLGEALDPARTPHALTSTFTMSAICYLVEKASTLATTADATSNERQWTKFLKTLARALKSTSLKVAKPIQPLPENKLMYHIKLLESRTTIEILQRGKTISEFGDLSKTDFSEQLCKHLC